MVNKISILIVEGWPIFRKGLSSILEENEEIILLEEAREKDDILNLIKEKQPDIILLDCFTSPYEEILEMLSNEIDSKIIIITPVYDHGVLREVFKYNISGFILMNTPPQNLVNAIKTVYNGGVYIYKEFIQELLRNSLNNAKKNDLILEHLTHKEEEVLNLLCEGLSNKKIAKILGMSEKTVKSHLTNIYSKLNVKSRLEAVIIAHRLLKR